MDRYLLKNIIIIILVLVNGFLLGSLALRRTAAAGAQERMEEQIVALFAADGMALERDIISRETPPASLSLARDLDREREAAVFFLGTGAIRSSQGGGTYSYTTGNGVAQFRSNGGFDMVGSLASGNSEALCREFCKRFSYEEPVFTLDDTGTGAGTAVCRSGKYPVYNGAVTFTVDKGALLTVSGVLLPAEGTAVSEERTPLSATAALTAFQQLRRESYAVVSAVTDLTLCYELQGSTASTRSLTPAWCVTTDTGKYYVNCITGVVTTG